MTRYLKINLDKLEEKYGASTLFIHLHVPPTDTLDAYKTDIYKELRKGRVYDQTWDDPEVISEVEE